MRASDWTLLLVLSLLVSACGVYGVSYVAGEGWPLLKPWAEVAISLILTPVVAALLFFADVAFTKGTARSTSDSVVRKAFDILTPRWTLPSILLFSLVMLLFWSPWYVANFPGGTYWDTYYQIFQVYPENHPIAVIPWAEIYNKTLTDAWLVDHHPVFTTLLYGAFGWTSDQLTGNWMAGVALFCILQGMAHCVAFSASVAYMRKVGCPSVLNLLAYAFFSLMPFVSTWAMCMVKDGTFGLFYVPYFMILFETVRTKGELMRRPRNIAFFALCALMLCLTKKTGIFVVVATGVVGAIAYRKSKPAVEAFVTQGLLSVVVIMVIFPLLLFPALNIQKGGAQETYGPLFQQTARYLHDYGDDVTPEEEEAIRAVLDYKLLASEYCFDFEDSVKYRYNLDATPSDMINYFRAYLAQGARHPDAYFGAFASLAGFYVAPTAFVNIRMVTVDTKMGPDDRYMLWNPKSLDDLRLGLDEAYAKMGETPVLNLPLLIVTYDFWLPALLAFIAFRNRLRSWTLFIPPLVLLFFCVIAPVYDGRYVVPILDGAPLFFCAVTVLLRQRMRPDKEPETPNRPETPNGSAMSNPLETPRTPLTARTNEASGRPACPACDETVNASCTMTETDFGGTDG